LGCIDSIEFDLKDANSQIVVYTEIQPNMPFMIKVSTSAVINSNQQILYPEDAHISISTEGSILDSNFLFRNRDMCYLGIDANEQIPYTLNVSLPGLNIIPVNAQAMIPASQKFQNIIPSEYKIDDLGDNTSYHSFKLEITIDQTNELGTNYFQIIPQRRRVEINEITGEETYLNEYDDLQVIGIEADENAVQILTHKPGVYVDGTILQSSSFMIQLETESPLLNDIDVFDYVHVTLKTMTYTTFKYNHLKNNQLASQDAPLFEPIISFSNINYGIGLFGALNSRVDSIYIR